MRRSTAPADGERNARSGYVSQDRAAARFIYKALRTKELEWVGLADRNAGILDDLVVCTRTSITGFQFKHEKPEPIGITALLLGESKYVSALATSYSGLRAEFPERSIRVHFSTTRSPSASDRLIKGQPNSSTKSFIKDKNAYPDRALAEWKATRWGPLFEELVTASGLSAPDFEQFWHDLDLLFVESKLANSAPFETEAEARQVTDIARIIGELIVDQPDRDRIGRLDIYQALGWRDPFQPQFSHSFPTGSYVQANDASARGLRASIDMAKRGYVSLLGSPGSGKSTLLQRELHEGPHTRVIRYLAFVPGGAQGQGRGEADNFYIDVMAGLANARAGLGSVQTGGFTTRELQEAFSRMLGEAGDIYKREGIRFLIVVDGLDHVPREEKPVRSLLMALPLPETLPDGVIIVLGSQSLAFPDLPPLVRQQAEHSDRSVQIEPLSEIAVERMAASLGLPSDISVGDVHDIGRGHPLVTRYLIERLCQAPDERDDLLVGRFGFDGDLERIYDTAWRGLSNDLNADEVKRVLILIGYAEGPIAPERLASATSDAAVERALTAAGHLLDRTDGIWTVFHNSFRLFLQAKTVNRFGEPDPAYSTKNVYLRLANLSVDASPTDPQRWLRFRYLLKADAETEALALASRPYFVNQYFEGRSGRAVQDDIDDAFVALGNTPDAAKLFELMLVHDEIYRRNSVIEQAASLPTAYVAAGDLRRATETLTDGYEEGRQWDVVAALLADGRTNDARRIFDSHSPFISDGHSLGHHSHISARDLDRWAELAIQFMDDAQIDRFLSDRLDGRSQPTSELEQDPTEIARMARFQIARSKVRKQPKIDLGDLAERWNIHDDHSLMLMIEAATALPEVEHGVARDLLRKAVEHPAMPALHHSWRLSAVRTALQLGEESIAREILKFSDPVDLSWIGRHDYQADIAGACNRLMAEICYRTQLNERQKELKRPVNNIVAGIQRHALNVATALGTLRRQTDAPVAARRICSDIISFLGSVGSASHDITERRHLSQAAAPLMRGVVKLSRLANAQDVLDFYDEALDRTSSGLAHLDDVRRSVALQCFRTDGDRAKARRRLEQGWSSAQQGSIYEKTESAADYALAFATIGDTVRAEELLSGIRQNALGVYLAAKKDGQYGLWRDVFVRANEQDPAGRLRRSECLLRLIDGLDASEGSNMGPRIVREVIHAAGGVSPGVAWNVLEWVGETGAASWSGTLDNVLKGCIERETIAPNVLLTTWGRLCLPWYREPHGGEIATGRFLADLIEAVSPDKIAKLERRAVDLVSEVGAPSVRCDILATLEQACASRGNAEIAKAAKARWQAEMESAVADDPDRRSYDELTSLEEIHEAIGRERLYYERRDIDQRAAFRMSFGLQEAIARILPSSPWPDAERLATDEPDILENRSITMGLVLSAKRAGDTNAAHRIAAPHLNSEDEGWDWVRSYGRLSKHQFARAVGLEAGGSTAMAEFHQDMANARFGVGSTLWEIEPILELLFDDVPWARLWDILETYIVDMHDHAIGTPLETKETVTSDEALLMQIFVRAITLGASELRTEAMRALRELLTGGEAGLVGDVITELLTKGFEERALGVEILVEAAADQTIASRFVVQLDELVKDPDAFVSEAASYLAKLWGRPLTRGSGFLPAFYDLAMPDEDDSESAVAADGKTRGLVLEEPFAWTAEWTDVVERIADSAVVSQSHVRRRAAQFITQWGGVAAFGSPASQRLESELSRLDLRIPYRRPQASAVLSALRRVIAELSRGGRLEWREVILLLDRLHSAPWKPTLPEPRPRNSSVPLPMAEHPRWTSDAQPWLDGVESDGRMVCASNRHLGAIYEERHHRLRGGSVCSSLYGNRLPTHPVDRLEDALYELPKVAFVDQPIALYGIEEASVSHLATFLIRTMASPDRLLIFCPHAANHLGWLQDEQAPDMFRDATRALMAHTVVWRDGLAQPADEDSRSSTGQYVELTEQGWAQYERRFGPPAMTARAWREIVDQENPNNNQRQMASHETTSP